MNASSHLRRAVSSLAMGNIGLGSAIAAEDSIQCSFQSANGVRWARSTWEVGRFNVGRWGGSTWEVSHNATLNRRRGGHYKSSP